MLKTYQRKTKLFEFSQDRKREKRKVNVTLQGLCCNGFAPSVRLCLQTKLPSFLTTGSFRKYQSPVKDF